MGCWHGTCAITQLPIHWEDRVRFMLLAIEGNDDKDDKDWTTGFCYATDRAFPITPAMPGIYNDYGGVELDMPLDPAAAFCLRQIGFNPDEELDFIDLLRSDDRPTFTRYADKLGIGLWMVKEEVYDHLLTIHGADDWRPVTHEALRAAADHTVNAYAAIAEMVRNGEDREKVYQASFRLDGRHDPESLFFRFERQPVNMRFGLGMLQIHMSNMATRGEGTVETLRSFAYALADAMRLNDAMETLRRPFMVQTGAGSQSSNLDAHESLARLTLDLIQKTRRRWDAEDGEED